MTIPGDVLDEIHRELTETCRALIPESDRLLQLLLLRGRFVALNGSRKPPDSARQGWFHRMAGPAMVRATRRKE